MYTVSPQHPYLPSADQKQYRYLLKKVVYKWTVKFTPVLFKADYTFGKYDLKIFLMTQFNFINLKCCKPFHVLITHQQSKTPLETQAFILSPN